MSCGDDILKAIEEGKLPKMSMAEAKRLIDEVDRIKEFVGETDGVTGPKFREAVKQHLLNEKITRVKKAIEAKENVLKFKANVDFALQPAFEGAPNKALLGRLLGGELKYSKGGSRGAAVVAEGLHQQRVAGLYSNLKESGLLDSAEKGVIDRDTAQEIFLIDQKKSGETKNTQAQTMAKFFRAVTDSILVDKRAAGSAVRRALNYIAKSTHDREKIMAVGFDKWKEDILASIDREKTYGFYSNERVETSLRGTYDAIVEAETSGGVFERVGKNISNEQSAARTFIFKDGHSWFDYNQKYGKGNLLETVLQESRKASNQTAMMEVFGTNTEKGFTDTVKQVEAQTGKKFTKAQKKDLAGAFSRAQGFSDVPGTELGARAGRVARVVQSLSKTGGAALSAMSDLAFSASRISSQTGSPLFGEIASQFNTWRSGISGKAERMEAAKKIGVHLDTFQAELFDKFGAGETQPGYLSRASQLFQKLNLMKFVDNAAALTGAEHHAMRLFDHSETKWGDLNSRLRLGLEKYGFDEKSWALASQGKDTVSSKKMLTVEAVRNLPDSAVKAIYGDANPDKTRFTVANNLLSAYNETVYASASRGSPRAKHILLGDSLDDGSWGTFQRLLVQFKEPMLMNLRTAGETLLSNPNTQPKSIGSALAGKGDFYGFSGLLIASMMLGYAKEAAKEAAAGRTPPDPTDPHVALRSFLNGGASGLYGDFLFRELHRNYGTTALELASGPVISEAGSIIDLGRKAMHGEAKWEDVFRKTWDNVPGHSLFYARGALDYLVSNNIREYLHPGFKAKLESRVNQQPGFGAPNQKYFMYQPTR